MLRIDSIKCNGCGTCLEFCPTGAISLIHGKAVINQRNCMECGMCLGVCPVGAIHEIAGVPPAVGVYQGSTVGREGKEVSRMPFGDGTGPRGLGPMTGRGAGYCAGFGMPGFYNPVPGGGYGGYGFGPGRGWGRGMGRGRGRGSGRGRGLGLGRGWGWRAPYW